MRHTAQDWRSSRIRSICLIQYHYTLSGFYPVVFEAARCLQLDEAIEREDCSPRAEIRTTTHRDDGERGHRRGGEEEERQPLRSQQPRARERRVDGPASLRCRHRVAHSMVRTESSFMRQRATRFPSPGRSRSHPSHATPPPLAPVCQWTASAFPRYSRFAAVVQRGVVVRVSSGLQGKVDAVSKSVQLTRITTKGDVICKYTCSLSEVCVRAEHPRVALTLGWCLLCACVF